MINPPPVESSFDENNLPRKAWVDFFLSLFRNSKYKGSGTTASRPLNGLNVGDWYYDTTLNKPVFISAVSPVAWRDAAGTVV